MRFDSTVSFLRRSWTRLVRPRLQIAALAWSGGRRLVLGLIAAHLLRGAAPVVFIVATSVLVGEIPAATGGDEGAWDRIITLFLVAAGALAVQPVLTPITMVLGEVLARRVDGGIFGRLLDATTRSPGIEPLENQALLDDLAEASRQLETGHQTPGRACAGLLALIARYEQLVGCAVVIGVGFSWPAAIAVVAATLVFRYGQRGGLRRYTQIFPRLAHRRREAEYLRDLAGGARSGPEVRVFGLVDWLSRRYRDRYLSWMRPVWTERRRIYLRPYLAYTTFGLLVVGTTLALLARQAAGTASLTGLALVVQSVLAAVRLGEGYPEADVPTQMGMNGFDAVRRVEHRIAAYERSATPTRPRPPAGPEPGGRLTFENVSFGYPGASAPVLDGLDLVIEAGRSTAVVGVNGAGKTTLIKLLARLYEPTSGVIRIDGTDIGSLPPERWRARISPVFQDFLRYETTAADNIAFGSIEHRDDRDGIVTAARRAGIAEVLERLPSGLDTPLARHMTGGVDLSGGQWQRVAIARALFALRHGASVLVLDEPTASLDIRAEARFYDEFLDLTRGATTILISHRFSTVRLADHIVVLGEGRVLEQGSHAALLEQGGAYARMFRLQAGQFNGPEPEPALPTRTGGVR